MLFVYLVALFTCVSVLFGSVVLLTVSGVWCASHTIAIALLIGVVILCSWGTYALFKAAHGELVYWF
jgi:hypothetical protein